MIKNLKKKEKHPPACAILHYISSTAVNPQALLDCPIKANPSGISRVLSYFSPHSLSVVHSPWASDPLIYLQITWTLDIRSESVAFVQDKCTQSLPLLSQQGSLVLQMRKRIIIISKKSYGNFILIKLWYYQTQYHLIHPFCHTWLEIVYHSPKPLKHGEITLGLPFLSFYFWVSRESCIVSVGSVLEVSLHLLFSFHVKFYHLERDLSSVLAYINCTENNWFHYEIFLHA